MRQLRQTTGYRAKTIRYAFSDPDSISSPAKTRNGCVLYCATRADRSQGDRTGPIPRRMQGSTKMLTGNCLGPAHFSTQAQRQIVKDFFIKFTKNPQKRCQKHCMAPDTSFDRLHFSVQQVFAEIRIVWQLVDIWLPAPLDFGQFQRIGCFQCMIVACHI